MGAWERREAGSRPNERQQVFEKKARRGPAVSVYKRRARTAAVSDEAPGPVGEGVKGDEGPPPFNQQLIKRRNV